jgi:hypothetical protein
MTNINRDWSKAPKVRPAPLAPELLARIDAKCHDDHAARLADMFNLLSSKRGLSCNFPATSYPAGYRPGEMRARDGNPAEAAVIAAWAAQDLPHDLSAPSAGTT